MPTSEIWPEGRRAAVSLTYDDAIPTQRTTAAQDLRARGLRGTFFLVGTADDLTRNRDAWKSLLLDGHELASHTMHHPCDRSHDWVPEGFATQDYDLPRMRDELGDSRELLEALGAPPPYTFAYPCGETEIGASRESYVPLVAEQFLAARASHGRLADPHEDPLELVPAHDGARSADALVALVDEAVSRGGWLVLTFHGVGGDHLPVDARAHRTLLDHLRRHESSVWTAPFGVVARRVRELRSEHGPRASVSTP